MKTVRHALEIIEILAAGHESQRLTAIAEKCGLNKTSTYKILATLAEFGYVEKSESSNRYQIGSKLLNMTAYILDKTDFRSIARPVMERVFRESQQTINLLMLVGTKGYYIEIVRLNDHIHMDRLGQMEHLYATALGKAILSVLPKNRVEEILNDDPPCALVEKTITEQRALFNELELTKKRGFAIDDEESRIGARCVAAPIFSREEVIGAISISGQASEISISQLFEFSALITEAAAEISGRLS